MKQARPSSSGPRARQPRPRRLTFAIARVSDAAEIADLLNAAADGLTRTHGNGHWSGQTSERGALLAIRPPMPRGAQRRTVTSRVLVARSAAAGGRLLGTLRLATKKPWAIDVSYFTPAARALYLTGMAVQPDLQRRGIGRRMLEEAARIARDWPIEPAPSAIRLDAYDAPGAGAAGFYARCGWREVARVRYKGNPLVYFELML